MKLIKTLTYIVSLWNIHDYTSFPSLSPIVMIENVNQIRNYQEYAIKGLSDLTSGNFQEALNDFDTALEVAKENKKTDLADLYLSRGIAFEKLEKWDEAINDYETANNIYKKNNYFSKDDPVAISNIANANTGKLKWKEALDGFSYAYKLNSKYLAPAIGKAFVQYELDNKKEAIDFFSQLTSQYPDYADGLAALAVMQYTQGQIEDAKENWEDALEQDSRFIDIDWVQNFRRWPPRLVQDLITFRKYIK